MNAVFFFFNDTATTEIYTLSLHDALPIFHAIQNRCPHEGGALSGGTLDGGDVICPLHGYRFNLETGACSTDPALRAKIFALVPHAGGFTVEARPDQTHHSA